MIINDKREISYEIMRFIACLLIIATHIYSHYFALYNKIQTISWMYSNVIMSFSRFSVPLFLCITGALALQKDIPLKKAILKSLKYLLILIIWSVVYIVFSRHIIHHASTDITKAINLIISNNVWYHLWYLYVLIGVYLILPIIQQLVRHTDKTFAKYFFALFLLSSILNTIPGILSLFNVNIKIYLNIPMTGYPFCVVLGYYLSNIGYNKKLLKLSYFIFLTSVIATILLTYCSCMVRGKSNQSFFANSGVNVILASMAAFYIIKQVSDRITLNKNIEIVIRLIGAISLNIYLIHPLIIKIYKLYWAKTINRFIPRLSLQYTTEYIMVTMIAIIAAIIITVMINQIKRIFLNLRPRILYHQNNALSGR